MTREDATQKGQVDWALQPPSPHLPPPSYPTLRPGGSQGWTTAPPPAPRIVPAPTAGAVAARLSGAALLFVGTWLFLDVATQAGRPTVGFFRSGIPLDVALVLAGAALYAQQESARRWAVGPPAVGVAGIGLLGAGAVLLYGGLGAVLPFPNEMGTLLTVAIVYACVVVVLKSIAKRPGPSGTVARAATEGAGRLLWLLLTVVGYLLVRPTLAHDVAHLEIYEYGVGLSIAGFLISRFKSAAKKRAPPNPYVSAAVRHAQHVRTIPDRRFLEVDSVVGAFVEQGAARDRYGEFVLRSLAGGRATPEAIKQAKDKVDAYADLLPPKWLATRKRLRAIAAENRKRRLMLHKSIMEIVEQEAG